MDRPPTAAALLLAAGEGLRAGGGAPKQYRLLAGKPVLRWSAEALARHPRIGTVHVVVAGGSEARARDLLAGLPVSVGTGGATRQQSAALGLQQLSAAAPDLVLIHDAARPLLPRDLIDRVLAALDEAPGACPALPVVDSLRHGGETGETLEGPVSRERLWRVQTPQGFHYPLIRAAHEVATEKAAATDDAELLRAAGHSVRIVAGDARAMKITHADDFRLAERLLPRVTLTGHGYDVHRFGAGRQLMLCGVVIPHPRGLVGHSDADVGLHALTDAVLGALGAGDIGQHFPPAEPRWKDAPSDRFLTHAAALVAAAGGRIRHCDLTLICEAPKIGPHRAAMLERLGAILAGHRPRISIKATTSERLGFAGRGEGIAAHALATIQLPDWDDL